MPKLLTAPRWRTSFGSVVAAALAVGVLCASALAPSTAAAATTPTTASVISSTKNGKLGTILVAARNTVYTLKASKTACTAQCLTAWPPVLLAEGDTAATAGPGVDASKLGTASAAGGALQVTYAGKRLYWFVQDTAPGQVHGNVTNKWGKWSTVAVKSGSASTDTNSTSTTAAPTTTVPSTQTEPAQTSPPQTAPPETTPPTTSPPATQPTNPPKPPSTNSPSTGGTAF